MGYLKLFRFISVMMVQTKCKLNNTELFLKLFHIQSKEIGSQSNGSVGRPLGFVIGRLNTSAAKPRYIGSLRAMIILHFHR